MVRQRDHGSVHGYAVHSEFSQRHAQSAWHAQTADQVREHVNRPEGIGANATFYDTSAFAPVPTSQAPRFGTMGRNSLRNPGVLRHDVMLSKDMRIRERVVVTLRAEAYNF